MELFDILTAKKLTLHMHCMLVVDCSVVNSTYFFLSISSFVEESNL